MPVRRFIRLVSLTLSTALLAAIIPIAPAAADACNPTTSNVGTDVVLTFSSVGTCTWTPPEWVTNVRVLLVAGGGGGGVNYRGGGGAGGMQEQASFTVTPGSAVTVTVGAGGSGAYYGPAYVAWWAGDPGGNQYSNTVSATNGANSVFGSLISIGGGFGSGCYSGSLPAGNGGSGGGSTGCTAGTGTTGQGSNGSTTGGGGGAGAMGGTAGGAGAASTITGATVDYAGGGGRQGSAGGSGGGGAGANVIGSFAQAGTDGTGGGGGGGGWFPDGSRDPAWTPTDPRNDTSFGGRGGSGIVIVRYSGRSAQSLSIASDKNPVITEQTATLSASGYSGTGAITYTVASGATSCSVSGSTLTALQPGNCTVTGTIAFDATYASATSSPLSITVNPRTTQTIAVDASPNPVSVGRRARLRVTGYSGTGAVTYSLASGSDNCSLSGGIVTGTSAGTCSVIADIAQDATYAAATSSPYTIRVEGTGSGNSSGNSGSNSGSGGSGSSSTPAATGGSGSATPRPQAGPPTAPRNFTARSRDGVLTLSWDTPESDGGQNIANYWLEMRAPDGQWEAMEWAFPNVHEYTVPNLSNGVTYEFRVRASNAAGSGPFAEVVRASVLVPRASGLAMPAEVPPQTFLTLGRVDDGKTYFKVATGSKRVCYLSDRQANAVAFMMSGTCVLRIFRDTSSVIGAPAGELETTVVEGVDRPKGVHPMLITRISFPAGTTALTNEARATITKIAQTWWPDGSRRRVGGAYVFCPDAAFHANGAVLATPGALLAKPNDMSKRCAAVNGTVLNEVEQWGAPTVYPPAPFPANTDPDANRVVEVAVLPRTWPPTPPLNLQVDAQTFDATATWETPAYLGGDSNVTYAVRYRVQGTDTWVNRRATTESAVIDFSALPMPPIGKEIELQVAAVNDAGSSDWASTTFRLAHRRPRVVDLPSVVPTQSWVPLFASRGRPFPVITTNDSGICAPAHNEYLIFTGPGTCTVRVGQLVSKNVGNSSTFSVDVRKDIPLPPDFHALDLLQISFTPNQADPDDASARVLADLNPSNTVGIHLYAMNPGSVTPGLVDRRWAAVWQALKVTAERSKDVSQSRIQTSGLPLGDGNQMTIGVIRDPSR